MGRACLVRQLGKSKSACSSHRFQRQREASQTTQTGTSFQKQAMRPVVRRSSFLGERQDLSAFPGIPPGDWVPGQREQRLGLSPEECTENLSENREWIRPQQAWLG